MKIRLAIKRIILKLLKRKRILLTWYSYKKTCIMGSAPYAKIFPLDLHNLEQTLIVVPHSDDEWIGCSQIIHRCKNVSIFYMLFYGDDIRPENIKTRNEELMKAAYFNHIKVFTPSPPNRLKESLIELMTYKQYDSIIIPSPFDWHPQHRKTFQIVLNTLLSLSQSKLFNPCVYYYHVTVPHIRTVNMYAIHMTKEQLYKKWNTFKQYYPSQSFMPLERFQFQERLDARGQKCYACELYIRRDLKQMMLDNKFIKSAYVENLNNMKKQIYNIFTIRLKIEHLSTIIKHQ